MKTIELSLTPEEAANDTLTRKCIESVINASHFEYQIIKRSIDARNNQIKINLKVNLYFSEPVPNRIIPKVYPNVSDKPKVNIIGFGPAGMFAALKLIENELCPVIIERGKDVRSRRRDLAAITKNQIVDENSNYCFGEGGAGTYSDGKLYTRSKKRGDVDEILATLIQHGADENILIDAHPHIGTNKLPRVVQAIRETILKSGGKIHFNTKMVDFIIENNTLIGITDQNGLNYFAENTILATGHSARDVFYLLHNKKINIESKPFAIGVRVEHQQSLINKIQYGRNSANDLLPPASYKLVHQTKNHGVFSFCMCPGGIIAPCATAPGEIVTNGWSPSKRNNTFSNSGIVVTINPDDLIEYKQYGSLAGLKFQETIEKKAFKAGKNDEKNNFGQIAPAQRLTDFLKNKTSTSLPECSYNPGLISAPIHQLFPKNITEALQEGFKEFGKKMYGFISEDAIIVAVESRTSSPVKIPRHRETLEHIEIKGFYPCGEGAGYAGGIVSAAIDGQNCAIEISKKYTPKS